MVARDNNGTATGTTIRQQQGQPRKAMSLSGRQTGEGIIDTRWWNRITEY